MNRIKLKNGDTISSKHTLREIRKRIVVLYQMMEGIPESRVNLDLYKSTLGETISCGTNACLLGWAALYPATDAWGLVPDKVSGDPILIDPVTKKVHERWSDDAGDAILWEGAHNVLFAGHSNGPWDSMLRKDHGRMDAKSLALARLKYAYREFLIPA